MAEPLNVTDATFNQEVLQSDLPVLVDFWAEWCGPCRMIGPVVKELAKEYDGKAKICKVDVDENSLVSQKYSISGIPALLFFKDGEIADRVIGAVPKGELVRRLNALMVAA